MNAELFENDVLFRCCWHVDVKKSFKQTTLHVTFPHIHTFRGNNCIYIVNHILENCVFHTNLKLVLPKLFASNVHCTRIEKMS